MPYLIKSDFPQVITLGNLDKLTNADDTVWQKALTSAIEEISSYLRNRYDVAAEFVIPEHVLSNTYTAGDRVVVSTGANTGFYVATVDVPASTAITDTNFWTPSDTRNAKLVVVAIIIILYENYTRINGTDIPNWLQLRYDGGDTMQRGGAIGYLKNIQKGVVQTSTPLLASVADGTDQSGNGIAFGVSEDVVNRNTSI